MMTHRQIAMMHKTGTVCYLFVYKQSDSSFMLITAIISPKSDSPSPSAQGQLQYHPKLLMASKEYRISEKTLQGMRSMMKMFATYIVTEAGLLWRGENPQRRHDDALVPFTYISIFS